MHQPTAQARASLYYPYRVYPAWLPSAQTSIPSEAVVIVGAGPSGLTAALELARHGIRCVVLSAELQVSEGSRAIVFTRRSMEILQQVGVAHRISQTGLPWRFGNSYYRGERVFRMEAPHEEDDRFFPMINLQQQYLEQYLVEAAMAHPLVELRWGNRLCEFTPSPDGVNLTIDTPEGPYTQSCQWLVAADGARSVVRGQLNLSMEGASYEGRFVIADIKIDLPLPTERRAYFDPDWNPGNTVLMHREPQGIWRIDYQLPPNETPEQALQPAAMAKRINALLAQIGFADRPWEMDWSSVYSARTLTLPSYVQGRIVFTGDAAHLLPIFGVRGANTGFQDSQSLGWHLAYALRGWGTPELLVNFSEERVAAAREIIQEGGRSTRFMTPPSRGFRLLRDAVLSLSLSQAFVRPLFHWRTSRAHTYTHSRLNSQGDDNALFKAGPAQGEPAFNARLGADDFLMDHLGGGFDLLVFSHAATLAPDLRAVIDDYRAKGRPLRVIAIGTPAMQGADLCLADEQGHLHRRYGAIGSCTAYLLRPDQHVCARWVNLDALRLQSALHTALGFGDAL